MAALSVIFISDIRIVNITNPFAEGGTTQFNDFVSYPLTVLWIVGVNQCNQFD